MSGEQPTRRLTPAQLYGWDYGDTKSRLVGVDSNGSLQVTVSPSGTQDVRALATSTIQIVASTVDVRVLGDSSIQVVAGTIDVRTLSSSTVQSQFFRTTTLNTGTIIQIGTTASTILAQNTSRHYAMVGLRNNEVMLGFGRAPSTHDYDFRLQANDTFEINEINLWQGNLQCIANNASGGTLEIVEW